MKLSVSTAWNALRCNSASEIVSEITSLGFDTIELNSQLDEPMLREILAIQQVGEICVSSLHNYCPAPPGVPRRESGAGSGFAALDESVRRAAVEQALVTFDWANRLGAQAVVVHIGHVEMQARFMEVRRLSVAGDPRAGRMLREDLAIRAELLPKHLEAAIKTVRELVAYSGNGGPKIGIECRMLYHEIPSLDEFRTILNEIPPNSGGYWHDFGHAQFRELCGLEPHRRYLEEYGDRLIGMHIHNMTSDAHDHVPLNRGIIDFDSLLPLIPIEPISVFEIHSNASSEEIAESRRIIEEAWAKSRR